MIYRWKVLKHKKTFGIKGNLQNKNIALLDLQDDKIVDRRGKLGASFRLLNRVLEQSYRQTISWIFQIRGYIVLYDRHFFFDSAIDEVTSNKNDYRASSRIHNFLLKYIFPKPDLILFLYAPAKVLFERKGEATLEYLDAKNRKYMNIGNTFNSFIKIDANQPVEKVYEAVRKEVLQLNQKSNNK